MALKKASSGISSTARQALFAMFVVATTISLTWAQTALPSFTPINIVRSAGAAPTFIPVARKPESKLSLTPDRGDWTYALGAKATIEIKFDIKPYPEKGIEIKYKLGPEMREGEEKSAVVPAAGLVLPVNSPTEPGFIRCIVTANLDGKSVREVATVGFSPEKIVPTQTEPADFDAFWAQQKAALAKIPADYQLTPAPKLSNDRIEVFYLSFQNVGNYKGPGRFYGVLAVPRGEGPFPIALNVPGAGVRAYQGNLKLAERGVITLQVGIHGIPVNLPEELYDQLERGALKEYPKYNLDDRYEYYYRRVYLGVLRAADYLANLAKWDRKNFVVSGSSQGGQLTIMTAALDSRVTAIAANYPAYSDVSGYLRGRTGGWPNLFRKQSDGKISDQPVEPKLLTTTYYDTVNFARRVKVPSHFFFGYNDDVTAPTSTFAAYNTVTAPK
jgi:cephalosporin-C deacetylase